MIGSLLKNGWTFIGLSLIILVTQFGGVYSKFYPPVEGFDIDYSESYAVRGSINRPEGTIETDVVVLYGSLDKRWCEFKGVTAFGHSKTKGVVPIWLEPRDQPGNDRTTDRVAGLQQFGPWFLTMTPRDDIWAVEFEAAHLCTKYGISWTTYTKLGTIVTITKLRKLGADK